MKTKYRSAPHPPRKPAVERFLGLYKEGTKPRQLRLPTGQYRGYLIGELDDTQLHSVLHGYRGCHWDDIADVIEIEQHRRQILGCNSNKQPMKNPRGGDTPAGLSSYVSAVDNGQNHSSERNLQW